MKLGAYALLAALALLGSLIVTPLWALMLSPLPTPEIALVVVVWTVLRSGGSLVSDLILALIVGYLTDLTSAFPRGLHMFTFGFTAALLRLFATRLLLEKPWQTMALTWVVTLLHQTLVLCLVAPLYGSGAALPWHRVPLTALTTCAVVPLCQHVVERLMGAVSTAGIARHA